MFAHLPGIGRFVTPVFQEARNHWMADQADFVIACLYRNFGGAHDMAAYAMKKGKKVINVVE